MEFPVFRCTMFSSINYLILATSGHSNVYYLLVQVSLLNFSLGNQVIFKSFESKTYGHRIFTDLLNDDDDNYQDDNDDDNDEDMQSYSQTEYTCKPILCLKRNYFQANQRGNSELNTYSSPEYANVSGKTITVRPTYPCPSYMQIPTSAHTG